MYVTRKIEFCKPDGFSGFHRYISIIFFFLGIIPFYYVSSLAYKYQSNAEIEMSKLSCLKIFQWYQNARSIGAIAGFAVAIVFTWRLLRSPSGPQRRQPKRQAPASSSSGISSQSNATLTTSGVSSSEDTRAQNVVDEFFQPVKVNVCQTGLHAPLY